jgi:asparaginyl-tRNA synthetase
LQLKGKWATTRSIQGNGNPTIKSHFELNVEEGAVFGECDGKTFPIQSKYHTPQFLRTVPHLRSRAPLYGEVVRFRSDLVNGFTNYFANAEFTQIHPPIITSSDCEGAGEAFTIHPASKPDQAGDEYFGTTKYLTVSSQLHLEAMAQGLGAVWALSPVFRAEDSDTGRHLSEFYMLEAELAFADNLDTIMDLTESCLVSVITWLSKTAGNAWIERSWENRGSARTLMGADGSSKVSATIGPKTTAAQRWRGMTQQEKRWPRITYTEAIRLLSKHKDRFEHKPVWGSELQTEHEKFLAVKVGGSDLELGYLPVFVTHYPREPSSPRSTHPS